MYTPYNVPFRKGDVYTQLISSMNEGVWIGDRNEKTTYANPKFCEMMGYTLEEMIGRESYDFWDRESAERVRSVNENERKAGKSSSYEGFLLTKNKKKIPVLLSGAPLPDGGTIGIMTDLTEVKKGQKAEQILSEALEHAGDAILLLDKKGGILSWNQGARKIFGYKKEEIEGKNISLLFPSLEERSFDNISTGEFMGLEMFASHKSEGERIVQVSITAVSHATSSHDPWALCIARDITVLKRSEIELSSRYQKIKDVYEWLGKVQRQNDYLTDLIEMTTEEYDKKRILPTILHGIVFLSGADACEIRLHNAEKDTLELLTHYGFEANLRNFKSISYAESWGSHAYTTEMPYYKLDFHDEKKNPLVQYYLQEGLQSSITIALKSKSGLLGCITMLSKGENVFELYENTFLQKYLKLVELILNALRQ